MQICDVLFVVAVDIAQAQSQVKILIRTKHSPPNIFNAQATDENIYVYLTVYLELETDNFASYYPFVSTKWFPVVTTGALHCLLINAPPPFISSNACTGMKLKSMLECVLLRILPWLNEKNSWLSLRFFLFMETICRMKGVPFQVS